MCYYRSVFVNKQTCKDDWKRNEKLIINYKCWNSFLLCWISLLISLYFDNNNSKQPFIKRNPSWHEYNVYVITFNALDIVHYSWVGIMNELHVLKLN